MEGAHQLAKVPNLVFEGPKFHQDPSPKSSAPHVLQNHALSLQGLPRGEGQYKCVRATTSKHLHCDPCRTPTNGERCAQRMKSRTPSVSGTASEQLNRATHQKITNGERCAQEAPSFLSTLMFKIRSVMGRSILLH